MNYGGHYRSTPETLLAQQDAEDLDVVYNLLVNKEERIPDIGYFRPGGGADPASGQRQIFHAQEYHTSFWGHLGLLNLEDHFLLPDYAAYKHTALASPWPNNGAISDLARAQGALVGYVHIADFPIDPPKEKVLSYELPATVAHGKVDYLEVMGFSDHHITAGIWYRLLNLGFRLPAGAGTDAMANYASLRGPIGLVRVFLETNGERTPKALLDALKSGRTFVSNGPLLGLEVDGKQPGRFARGRGQASPSASRCARPLPSITSSCVQNGRVIKSFELTGDRTRFDWSGDVAFEGGGWLVLRAFNDQPNPWVLDLYPYATTSPIYFEATATAGAGRRGLLRRLDGPRRRGGRRARRLEQRDRKVRYARLPGAREGEIPRARKISDQGLTMTRMPAFTGLLAGAALSLSAAAAEPTKFTVDDLVRIANVTDLDLSPDGEHVVYSVGEPNFEEDAAHYDLWRARWDGSDKRALTRTADADEYQASYSPDGKWIAFLSDRGDDDAETQVWVMPADGGEAEALTTFPGGVSDFDWSPDSARLAVIADDPERPEGEEEPKQPKPIVIDRYYFKEDYVGWLTDKRQHLYLFEIAGKKATQLTSGSHDEHLPTWSPDGTRIAYVTKRGPDPDRHLNWDIYVVEARDGGAEKPVTRFVGADNDPSLESRPAWSPDGKRIAYLQAGEDKWIYYAPWSLAVVDVASGAVTRPAGVELNHTRPRFTADGSAVLALVEESRVTHVSRIELATGAVDARSRRARASTTASTRRQMAASRSSAATGCIRTASRPRKPRGFASSPTRTNG